MTNQLVIDVLRREEYAARDSGEYDTAKAFQSAVKILTEHAGWTTDAHNGQAVAPPPVVPQRRIVRPTLGFFRRGEFLIRRGRSHSKECGYYEHYAKVEHILKVAQCIEDKFPSRLPKLKDLIEAVDGVNRTRTTVVLAWIKEDGHGTPPFTGLADRLHQVWENLPAPPGEENDVTLLSRHIEEGVGDPDDTPVEVEKADAPIKARPPFVCPVDDEGNLDLSLVTGDWLCDYDLSVKIPSPTLAPGKYKVGGTGKATGRNGVLRFWYNKSNEEMDRPPFSTTGWAFVALAVRYIDREGQHGFTMSQVRKSIISMLSLKPNRSTARLNHSSDVLVAWLNEKNLIEEVGTKGKETLYAPTSPRIFGTMRCAWNKLTPPDDEE